MTTKLAEKQCVPCKGGAPPLRGDALTALEAELGHEWRVVDGHHLEKEFKFKGFQPVVDFVNRVARIAEEQNHHPDICFGWGKAKITIYTHKIDGLTESDFVFAAKAEAEAGQ